tara:strand:- start:71 stop:565 length:495 start_codon:yes stop_codon:yes gene_type:complete
MPKAISIEIVAIYISPDHDFKGRHGMERYHNPIHAIKNVSCVKDKGLVGDRYFDFRENYKGQITFFSWEIYEGMRNKFDKSDLSSKVLRRNIILKGVDLNNLIGKEFTIQNVTFSGSEECAPCYWMNEAITPGAEIFLKNKGGLRARILNNGVLTRGKTILTVK